MFTIHNLNYGKKKLSEAAYFCQKFTTVSPTYAFETGGCGRCERCVWQVCVGGRCVREVWQHRCVWGPPSFVCCI